MHNATSSKCREKKKGQTGDRTRDSLTLVKDRCATLPPQARDESRHGPGSREGGHQSAKPRPDPSASLNLVRVRYHYATQPESGGIINSLP